mmetsp:Transcript_16274/g.18103  ORF Transcript_16274/g.18103 Transcript_16274/m.18103 type:complete len:183 (-) Transcript_16274:103-651(-)|eukprot:CAMPEP_0168518678 /NCGR_PEP_ID=MMETSP0405-20121227/6862_1 /TAXON_ID=498012 /ORGANISM="Trichosphaerium sp, Strain Am-I-7 wt" /LENGTH=182 /DNA_ID=CAMNT_0008539069 /DNA_START=38 /DNA_END=586 /DNA_ORIENTATION=+
MSFLPLDRQLSKSYQKQDNLYIPNRLRNRARITKGFKGKKRETLLGNRNCRLRTFKQIGLGFATPETAKTGDFVDRKCPWTGDRVSIRGKIIRGVVLSAGAMTNTIVIRRNYLQYVPKYNRFEKRHKNVSAHCSPAFLGIKEGDIVTIGECRPLSKTVMFNVIDHKVMAPSAQKVRKVFRIY